MKITKGSIVRTVIFCMIIFCVGVMIDHRMSSDLDQMSQNIGGSWNIQINKDAYSNVTLSQFKVPKLQVGDKFTLSRTMEATTYSQTVLRVYTRYSAIRVYLDDTLLYQSGQKEYEKGQVIGNGYHWIPLPNDFAGKNLSIIYDIGEVNAFTSVDPIVLMDSLGVFHEMLHDQIIAGMVSICLIVIGLVSLLACVATGFGDTRFQMLFSLGIFSLSIGCWISSNTRLMEVFTHNLQAICYMEYLGMYVACASMLAYVAVFFKQKRERKLFHGLEYGFIVLSIIFIIFNQMNILHFPKTVLVFHAYALLSAMLVIYVLGKEAKWHRKAEQLFLIGIVVLACVVILELARYRYNKICIPAYKIDQSIIPIGMIAFILFVFSSFFARILERVAEEMERKTLYDMAYQDALTGIKNRAWCEKVMEDFHKNAKPVTIINMDLNYFKLVNDTLGHAVGDELLTRFAKILSSSFKENDCIGRMGGDEFVAILDYTSDDAVEARMSVLRNKIKEENAKKEFNYEISVSYGYASDETDSKVSPWRVYEMADQKMYQYKKKMKSRNKIMKESK